MYIFRLSNKNVRISSRVHGEPGMSETLGYWIGSEFLVNASLKVYKENSVLKSCHVIDIGLKVYSV